MIHNPHNLTDEQIGTQEGWRLLTVDELNCISKGTLDEIQSWVARLSYWEAGYTGNCIDLTYRTKLTPEELFKKKTE